MSDYELAVLDAGATGLAAARAARKADRSVAIIDKADPGGDCTYYGCVPSKTLLDVAHRVAGARAAQEGGRRRRSRPSTGSTPSSTLTAGLCSPLRRG